MRKYRIVPQSGDKFRQLIDSIPLADEFMVLLKASTIKHVEIDIRNNTWEILLNTYRYLPEDMLYINFQTEEQYTCTPLTKGVHYISVALNEVPLFLRKDRILPLCKSARCTDLLNLNHLELLYYTNSRAAYTLYEDDGISKRQNGKILILTVTKKNGGYTAACEDVEKTLSLGRISYA